MTYSRRFILSTLVSVPLLVACRKGKAAEADNWTLFKSRFFKDGRISDSGNGNISHSEGQGYGMIQAEAAHDKATFDALWQWTKTHLMRPDMALFAWRFDPSQSNPVSDQNNATDGDILIAWALLRAEKRWPKNGYGQDSEAIRKSIGKKLVLSGGGETILLPGLQGFTGTDYVILNFSYYIWPALKAFNEADNGAWHNVIESGKKLLAKAKFGLPQLPTDWVAFKSNGNLEPAADKQPYFGFDAVRIPLYLIWGGEDALAAPFAIYWNSYLSHNQPVPAWVDVNSQAIAPYPLSKGGMAILDLAMNKPITAKIADQDDYYSSALLALSEIAAKERPHNR
ncbi:glycosyl hydrolase family 8 [Zymomonas mobilis]|uniref:glycosyl hydrolase family 8 n=1 Tax=Zymomonas mobilis TaxID=542 RepID=UPI0003C745F0|nr:glycosyl hydrolase family 8 [Zymomonas mobilis]AHB09570.1 endoglucanase Y [Zymomonas mobilis subsp. mobilis str. CP4 = NRRL B-14023]AHJ69877.1 Minor endoglucanase Y precursor [Zymomonas mobilis subsp. mobilis NRRL B-12526]AHJ71732.1 Minor endoglucanase Y precursor [Zymomonas mobilis subsp. mobilis str. CP4 = NRRL B-14023]TWE25150.1 endoglucanase [Zymomonas mobilis]